MKYVSILAGLLMILAGAAFGEPIDPDPNGIGIFFDEGGEVWCADALVGNQLTAYLCLTRAEDEFGNPDETGFTAWEGRIEASAPNVLVGYSLRGDATNSASEPEFVVAMGTPLPYQISTVLLEMTVEVTWEWAIGLRVWPSSNPRGPSNLPAFETAGNPGVFRNLQYTLGWDLPTEVPNWCAGINDDTCLGGPQVATEVQTWGTVKALYRD